MGNNNTECKILLVDDMEMNVIILAEIIKSLGYTPLSALSAKEALDILRNDLPQLILLDVSMPDMTGLEFCELLKEDIYTRDIPVIFISAMDSQDDLSKAFELGAVDYIFKPFEPNDVKMRVNTHLKLYNMQRELEDANKELNRVIKQQLAGGQKRQRSYYKAIEILASARDEKASHTYGYESKMARILTQAMQFSPDFEDFVSENFILEMEMAAAIHDIGMLKIPERIILKEGKLTDEEYELVKNHTVYGSQVLSENVLNNSEPTKLDTVIYEVIRHHHERYDGNGYPDGLKGEEIPLCARIMAVIDAFDAIINERCYKKAFSIDEAIEIMEEESGKIYDPKILAVLKKVKRQYENNKI